MVQELAGGNLDAAAFGIIGFDAGCLVQIYNQTESQAAGLSADRVMGRHLFEVVAPCMNNYLVAQRFEDALRDGSELDTVIDYVLTLRMRPTPVRLRLLASPSLPLRYLLVERG
jgi:photoactive yellow protein